MTVSQNCPCAPTPGGAHEVSYVAGSAYCVHCKQKVEGCCEGQPPEVALDAHAAKEAYGVKRP